MAKKLDKSRKPFSGRRGFSFSGHAIPDKKPDEDLSWLEEMIMDILSSYLANISGLSTEEGDLLGDENLPDIIYNYMNYYIKRTELGRVFGVFPIWADNFDGLTVVGIYNGSKTNIGAVGITEGNGIDVSFTGGMADISADLEGGPGIKIDDADTLTIEAELTEDGGLEFSEEGNDGTLQVVPCDFLVCCGD